MSQTSGESLKVHRLFRQRGMVPMFPKRSMFEADSRNLPYFGPPHLFSLACFTNVSDKYATADHLLRWQPQLLSSSSTQQEKNLDDAARELC